MTEQTWRRVTGWAAVLVLLLAFVILVQQLDWLIKPLLGVLPPFVVAFILAFLLNPLITRLEGRGMSRNFAALSVSLVFLLIFGGFAFYLVPKAVEQGIQLAQDMPEYAQTVGTQVNQLLARERTILERFNLPTSVQDALQQFSDQISVATTASLRTISNFILSLIDTILWLLLVPILTLYLLNDWQRLRRKVPNLIPEAQRARWIPLFEAIGNVFNSYVRGQIILVVLYGLTTTLVLMLFGVHYSLVLGLIAGLVSPIPFLGSVVILLTTTSVAFVQSGSWLFALWVAVAMMVQNNFLFDNLIAPRVLGKAVGLNLAWSIFALLLGGAMFGIIGMIIAVPMGAVIQVFLCSYFPKLCQEPPDVPDERKVRSGRSLAKRRKGSS